MASFLKEQVRNELPPAQRELLGMIREEWDQLMPEICDYCEDGKCSAKEKEVDCSVLNCPKADQYFSKGGENAF